MKTTTNVYDKDFITLAEFSNLLNNLQPNTLIIFTEPTNYLTKYSVTIGGGWWRTSKGLVERYMKYTNGPTTAAVLRRKMKITNALA